MEQNKETLIELTNEDLNNVNVVRQMEESLNSKRLILSDLETNIHILTKKAIALKDEIPVLTEEYKSSNLQVSNMLMQKYGKFEFVGPNQIKKVGN